MIALYIVITIVIGVIGAIGTCCYAEFKEKELEFKKEQAKNVTQLTDVETKLEIEREKTKQLQIKSDYKEKHHYEIPEKDLEIELEKEKTKQLEIKSNFYKEHNERLY